METIQAYLHLCPPQPHCSRIWLHVVSCCLWRQTLYSPGLFHQGSTRQNYSMSTLSWSLIRNSCVGSMPSTMYAVLCLTTFLSFHNSKFQVHPAHFTCSRLKQVLWWLHVRCQIIVNSMEVASTPAMTIQSLDNSRTNNFPDFLKGS